MTDLPPIIPLFPLPNLVMFPGVRVPLHIFEPRYRQMVADISASHRMIGMMLLKGGVETDDYQNMSDIFEIGCAGRISALTRLDDGRYNLMLDGVAEFRVLREIRDRAYRQAETEWCPVSPIDLACDAETMDSIRELLFGYLGEPAKDAWRTLVESRGLRGAQLVNFICFHLDLSPIEKQTMLEARSGRIDTLLDVLSFRVEERKSGRSGSGNSSESVQ